MQVRKGVIEDYNRIIEVYEGARQFMRESGNSTQWGTTHPSNDLVKNDIRDGICHVILDEDKVVGVFALLFDEDPTYTYIEDGSWLNDKPYGTIHRIAGDVNVRGILKTALEYATTKIDNIRIDTHEDNQKMQYLLEKYGFKRCGIIYLADGRPRIAYHYEK
ncbi:MAG: N-acetyltransferase [Eubacteriales bacterium]|nr:N-acetyltransferase [Eubacteriales bacterium]